MSFGTCAVMLVKDEEDVVGYTVDWMLSQVDYVIVADNGSSDATRSIVAERAGDRLQLVDDPELGYWQSRKTTELAMHALSRGFRWVVPVDADEFWYAPDGRRIADYLDGLSPDVQVVPAEIYHHLPSGEDGDDPNPFIRIGWRKREHGSLPKVACRLRPDLVIHAGNHGCSTNGTAVRSGGLVVRHFSWRTPKQYVRKIRNGEKAYAATDLPESVGAHWRMWEGKPDKALLDHFYSWFYSPAPRADETLIYDPAPYVLPNEDVGPPNAYVSDWRGR